MQATAQREFRNLRFIGPAYLVVIAIAAAIAIFGAYGWMNLQLRMGLGITGMNAPTFWGAYIVNFVFFVGLSAGGIIVSSLVHALNLQEYRTVARIAELVAIISIVMAALFITLDLGRPDRIWHLVRYGRIGSPLMWDVFIVNAYLLMAMALGYFSTRIDIVRCARAIPSRAWFYRLLALGYMDESPRAVHRDLVILRVLSFLSIPTAVLLHSVTAWIMGLAKATPGWHTSLLAPVFIGSALASGLALVTLVSYLSQRLLGAPVEDRTIGKLGRLVLLSLPVLGYLLFSEMITVVFAREPSPAAFFRELMSGRYAPFFWFDLVLGIVAPALMLALVAWRGPRATPGGTTRIAIAGALAVVAVVATLLAAATLRQGGLVVGLALIVLAGAAFITLVTQLGEASAVAVAAVLVVLGVLAERINIVLVPQLTRWSASPDETFALPYRIAAYRPTFQELTIVAGVYAFGVLVFLVLAKVFPLVEVSEEESTGAGPAS